MLKINQKSLNYLTPQGSPAANDNVSIVEQNSNINKGMAGSWRRYCLSCRHLFVALSPLIRVCASCKTLEDWQENVGHFEFHPPPPEMEEDE